MLGILAVVAWYYYLKASRPMQKQGWRVLKAIGLHYLLTIGVGLLMLGFEDTDLGMPVDLIGLLLIYALPIGLYLSARGRAKAAQP